VAERNAATLERDTATVERDAALIEHDAAVAGRDAAVAERDGLRAADRLPVEEALRARAEAEVERLRAELAEAQPTVAEIRALLAARPR
jgi:hypothetical protein